MRIIWISQVFVTDKETGNIGFTDRVEMPQSLYRQGHKVKVILGASPKHAFLQPKLLPHKDTIYLPMINRPFLTTLSFQLTLFLVLPLIILTFNPDSVIVDHFTVHTLIPWILLKRLGLLSSSMVLDVRTLPVDVQGSRSNITVTRFDQSIQLAWKFFDGITVITPEMRNTLVEKFLMVSERIGVWESGVNLQMFMKAKSRREELGWQDKFVVMYHGTLSPNRGLQNVVTAFSLIKNQLPDVYLCFLGAGEARKELQDLIIRFELQDRVWLFSPVPYEEVADYVLSADIGIIPLPNIEWWSTSSPLKLMEYLAAGKPVIVSDITAHRQIVRDSTCVYYLAELSPEEILRGIKFFYSRKSILQELGDSGQEIIKSYSWDAQASSLINYLVEIRKSSSRYLIS